MQWFRFVILILVLTLLQAGAVEALAVGSVSINLLLIGLVFFSIYCNTTDAIVTSFVIGFCADLVGPTMGVYTLSFGIWGSALAYLHRVIAVRQMSYQAIVIILMGLLSLGTCWLLSSLRGDAAAKNVFKFIVGTSIYSGLVGPFLFLPIAWWMRIKIRGFSRNKR